jgi:lipopolysaccharide export system permease protein
MTLQAIPIASLLASVICMVLISRTNEITAMRAAGMGPLRVGAPVAIGGIILCVISALLGELVVPKTAQKMRYVESVLIEKEKDVSFIEGTQWFRNDDLLYNFVDYNTVEQSLIGVQIIKVGKPFRTRRTIMADKATYREKSKDWYLTGVKIYYFWPNGTLSYNEKRPDLILDIPLDPSKLQKERRLSTEKSYKELRALIHHNQAQGSDVLSDRVDMHIKIAFYFASFVVSLIGLKFGYKSERSMETARGVLLAIAVGISYWFILNAGKALAKRGSIDPFIAAWLSNLIILSISIIVIYRAKKA